MATSIPKPSVARKLWLRWKAIRFPWRKQFLIGADLLGNTFWEFKLTRSSQERVRRIVKYTYDVQHSDVKLSPAWIQWLRHTRTDAPSIREQELDIVRQEQMKLLAAKADARWAAQPSYLVAPEQQDMLGADLDKMAKLALPQEAEEESQEAIPSNASKTSPAAKAASSKESPWKKAAATTMDEPQAWTPKTIAR